MKAQTRKFNTLLLALMLATIPVNCVTTGVDPHVGLLQEDYRAVADEGRGVAEALEAEAAELVARGDAAGAARRSSQANIVRQTATKLDQSAELAGRLSIEQQKLGAENKKLQGAAGYREGVEDFISGLGYLFWMLLLLIVTAVGALLYFSWKSGGVFNLASGLAAKAGSLASGGLSAITGLWRGGR